jgi:O-antigen ligase
MALFLSLVIALIPLAIAPGLFFYFDVTPKIALLLLGTAGAAICWTATGGARGFHRASRAARWFVLTLSLMAASLVVSTLASVNPALSLGGSNWRRWGLVTQVAALALAYLVAACCAGRPDRLRLMLRAIAMSGLIAAVYGAAQYFGWDPLLDARAYQVGEGIWTIVRPPSTLGHADYFGSWLLSAIFAGAALVQVETGRFWRWLGWASIGAGSIAVFLSGTRAAIIGLAGGVALLGLLLALWRGVRITRAIVVGAGLVVAAAVVFYLSPAGLKMRARVHWSLQEPAGGARLLLWRDTLWMAASRWPVGYGPETFISSFARVQSAELGRTYPDFYHESPHNVFLDALAAQGMPGLLALAALSVVGFAAAWKARESQPEVASALAGGLAAMTISEQFTSFMLPTALAYYLLAAMLVSLTCRVALKPRPCGKRWPAVAAAVSFAGLLVTFAVRLIVAENALAAVRRDLDTGLLSDAAVEYIRFENWRTPGGGADLWYSRRLVQLAANSTDVTTRMRALQQAARAALGATETAEDPFNAYYNAAEFYASRNDFARTEQSLRAAISRAPNWFKPHWMLAQVFEAAGRLREAETEALQGVALDGGKHEEVTRTLDQIRAQLHGGRP